MLDVEHSSGMDHLWGLNHEKKEGGSWVDLNNAGRTSRRNSVLDLEIIILSEVSQTEKDKYHMISLTCGIWNMTQMNLFTKQKQTHRHRKQIYGYQSGKGVGKG